MSSVSNTAAVMEIRPWCTGSGVSAAAAAMGAVPTPASLEKTPRLTPAWTAPSRPPKAARGRTASRSTVPRTRGSSGSRTQRIQRQQKRYSPPISGTG